MAIGYTPQTWVDGSAPALSAANLQTMDNGINSACDALDAMAADGTGVADATTEVKGRVMLATTGVEAATKVPKATGAEIAALLTAGGYTLTAPSGSNSLDGIADTATWKKVAAAVATALNAGTYTASDAGKVSAFGIGLDTAPILNTEAGIDAAKSGLYRFYSESEGPFLGSGTVLLIMKWAAVGTTVIAIQNDGAMKYRYHGSTSWKSIWTSYSDGNGGQPPAPKPTTGTPAGGTNGVGKVTTAYGVAAGTTIYYSGTANLAGTWELFLFSKVAASGAFNYCDYSIGSGLKGTVITGNSYDLIARRIS